MGLLNLKLVLNDNGSITAKWDRLSQAIRYEAFMYPVGESFAIYNEKNLKTTSYTSKDGLEDNTQYSVTVSAYSSSKLLDSAAVRILIPLGFYNNKPLDVPKNVRATADRVSVTVSFDQVNRASGYDILFDGSVYNVTSTSKKFTGLQSNTSHTYAVRAKNAKQTSAYSTTKTIMTHMQAPAMPSNIVQSATETTATISWKASNGATGYDIDFNGTIYSVTINSKTFTGLVAGKIYPFQIRAKNASGYSAYTSVLGVTTPSKPPKSISATSTENTVELNWSAIPIASGYTIRFNGTDFQTSKTSRLFTGLEPNTVYTYQICAKSVDGSGSYSALQTIKTLPKAPAVPSDIRKSVTETAATISWEAVNGATGYDIQFNETDYSLTVNSRTFTGLVSGKAYPFKIRSKNANASSAYTASMMVTTAPKPPTPISAVSTENTVKLDWNAVTGASGYTTRFNGTDFQTARTSSSFSNLESNTAYTYQICSKSVDGAGSYSALQTIKTLPKIPEEVTLSVNENSVTVSWDAVPGATGYDLLFDGTVYPLEETCKLFENLEPNTDYTWQIRSKNEDGVSTYSPEQTVRTTPAAPASASAVTNENSVTLSWDAVSGAMGYDVLFDGKSYHVKGNSITFEELTPNTDYTWQVSSTNANGGSTYSPEQTVKTTPKSPSSTSSSTNENSVTASWEDVPGATGYDVMFNGSTESTTENSKTFDGLTPNTDYTWQVSSTNANGGSTYSPEQTATTTPTAPTSTNASSSENSATVSWDDVDGATGYDIMFNGSLNSVTESSKTFEGLTPNTEYSYQIRVKNANGESSYGSQKSVRTAPMSPTDFDVGTTDNSATVSWDPVSGATSYDLLFDGETYRVADTSKTFDDLEAGTSYDYQVRSNNEDGSSSYSPVKTVTTSINPPSMPTDVTAFATLESATVSFSSADRAKSYDVLFGETTYNVTGTSKTITGLKPGTSYIYSVRANNVGGSSEHSQPQTIKTKISNQNGLPEFSPSKNYPDGKIPYMGMDPVNAINGAFLWSYTFLQDYKKDALHFTVMYDSKREKYAKAMGRKWTYSLNYLLNIDSNYAYFCTPYDEVIPFCIDEEDGSFQPVEGIKTDYTMGRREEQTYFVRNIDGSEYIFDSNLSLRQIVENGLVTYQFNSDSEGQITRIEGRYGAVLTLAYTGGHISSVTDVMGNAITFSYEGDYIASIANTEDNCMTFSYNDSGNMLEILDFSGEVYLTNQYDGYGRVMLQNIVGRGNSFASYDEENRVNVFTDELGNETKYYYDEEFRIKCVELADCSIQNIYNSEGRLTEQVDGIDNSTKMAYDECGRINHVTYSDGTNEQILYNERNYPIRIVNKDGTESSYEYDMRNNLISARDERGNIGTYAYDGNDDLISYTDKNDQVWNYTYDANHHLERAEDPEGNIYLYSHDAMGRLLSYTSPTEKTTTYQYSSAGLLLRMADTDGTVTFDYNKNGNTIGVTDKLGNKQRLEYNKMGQVSMATDFMGNEYHFTYDERGNLIQETDPLGYSTSYTYDAMGNNISQTDKNGNITRYSFDAANQLTEVRDAADGLVKYIYDTMGQIQTITDTLNNPTNYEYDDAGRLLNVTNAFLDSVSYTYDELGNLLTKTDESGAIIAYAYDKENRLISVRSDAGTSHFTYDKLGRVVIVQDEDGNFETAEYDGSGNITAYADKENSRTTYIYDQSGHLLEETNPISGKTSYAYDKNGNCIKLTNAVGNEYLYEYDAENRMTKVTNPLGHETAYEYDARGNLNTVIDAKGGKTAFEYDGNGNLTKEINPVGGIASYIYDNLNRLICATDEEGNKRSFVYDANGNMTSYTDANENSWTYEYDVLNRLKNVIDQDGLCLALAYTKTGKIETVTDQEGAQTSYRYDSMGRLVEMSDVLEHSLAWTYDSQGRVLTQTDANGNITEYEYSPMGNLLQVKDPEGHITVYNYNALGQVLSETNALGSVTAYEYDALGQVTSITDALGAKTSFAYTANGKIAAVTDENGGVTHYQYDACGNLMQTTNSLGNVVVYEYDAMNNQIKECLSADQEQTCATIYQYDKKGRLIREINPMSDEKSYTYDGNGNILKILDEDKQETSVRYNLNNQPVSMCYSDGKKAVFRYNKRGELVELTDWNGITAMEHGRTGRLSKVTDHNGRVTGYSYDAVGNITDITYSDGSVVNYAFDKNNRMTKVTDAEGNITKHAYDSIGNVLSIKQPGSTSTFTYNAKGLPEKMQYQFDDGTTMADSFTYDAIGRITGSEREGNSSELTKSTVYSYDTLGQLLSWKEGQITETYGYDVLGNRISKKVNDSEKVSYQYNTLNQLTGRTENGLQYDYSYDKRGNLTEEKLGNKLLKQYIYDATGHMCQGHDLKSGERMEYGYNALYMRVKDVQILQDKKGGYQSYVGSEESKVPSLITRDTSYVIDFLSDTNNELMSYEKDFGITRNTYGRGYECLSQKVTLNTDTLMTPRAVIASVGSGKAYFQSDLRGSALFASNEQGDILRYAQRGAWGELKFPVQGDLNATGLENNLRFTNYSYEPTIGKHFAQARFYDAEQGRMLGRDPLKRGLNAYPYCDSDPVNYVDPTGEIPSILIGGGIGGLVGGIFSFAGSAVSQITNGEKFNAGKAWGAAANGAIVGAVRGAMVGSGIGLIGSMVANFTAGAVGSAVEQRIGSRKFSFGKSIVGGLNNAVSGRIYGNGVLKSAKDAIIRGAGAGAATAGINSLYDTWNNRGMNSMDNADPLRSSKGLTDSSYMGSYDPKSGCGALSPFIGNIGYSKANGYQYKTFQTGSTHKKQGKFKLGDFAKDVLIGAVTGGLSSVTFYGAGKAVGAVSRSIRSNKGGSQTSNPNKYYIPRDDNGNPIPLAKQRVNGQDIPLPDPNAQGPHTVLGGQISSKTGLPYRQTATFPEGTWPTANGKNVPWSEVHWGDHGTPEYHVNPHQHKFIYDFLQRKWMRQGPSNFYY